MHTLNELGPSKLLQDEQGRIRSAADNLIFSSDLSEDLAVREALADIEHLCTALVDSGRWERVTATRLANDLRDCGPGRAAELRAA